MAADWSAHERLDEADVNAPLVVSEFDVPLPGGGTLHAYDTGSQGDGLLPVFWHHGTPNLGTPPAPLYAEAARLGIRWVSYDRPGYGGSTARPGRSIATAAEYVAALADSLDIDRFGVMGHSGGGPHALACAALLGGRVVGAVSVSGPAPFGADGLDWFAGMADLTRASLEAATAGRAVKTAFEESAPEGDLGFVAADHEAFDGAWGWFGTVVGPALAAGPAALIDDDLATVSPWGFDPADIGVPVLVLHGEDDRLIPCSHGEWLAARCRSAELMLAPGDGHISVLRSGPAVLEWLRQQADHT